MSDRKALAVAKFWVALFSAALITSGLTAIFAREGLRLLSPIYGDESLLRTTFPAMARWLSLVHRAVEEVYGQYPFLAYGYDWLAFGHFVISIPFIMAVRDPRRHSWVIAYGIAACVAVIPFAIVFGAIRGIPLFWVLVDTCFGIVGLAVLLILRRQLRDLPAKGT